MPPPTFGRDSGRRGPRPDDQAGDELQRRSFQLPPALTQRGPAHTHRLLADPPQAGNEEDSTEDLPYSSELEYWVRTVRRVRTDHGDVLMRDAGSREARRLSDEELRSYLHAAAREARRESEGVRRQFEVFNVYPPPLEHPHPGASAERARPAAIQDAQMAAMQLAWTEAEIEAAMQLDVDGAAPSPRLIPPRMAQLDVDPPRRAPPDRSSWTEHRLARLARSPASMLRTSSPPSVLRPTDAATPSSLRALAQILAEPRPEERAEQEAVQLESMREGTDQLALTDRSTGERFGHLEDDGVYVVHSGSTFLVPPGRVVRGQAAGEEQDEESSSDDEREEPPGPLPGMVAVMLFHDFRRRKRALDAPAKCTETHAAACEFIDKADAKQAPAVPAQFLCPLSLTAMRDPHVACDGITYERAYVREAMRGNRLSPVTRQPLRCSQLFENIGVRALMEAWAVEAARKLACLAEDAPALHVLRAATARLEASE